MVSRVCCWCRDKSWRKLSFHWLVCLKNTYILVSERSEDIRFVLPPTRNRWVSSNAIILWALMHFDWYGGRLTGRTDVCLDVSSSYSIMSSSWQKSQVVLTYGGNLSSSPSCVTVLSQPAESAHKKRAGQYLNCCPCTDSALDWVGNGSEQPDADSPITALIWNDQSKGTKLLDHDHLLDCSV